MLVRKNLPFPFCCLYDTSTCNDVNPEKAYQSANKGDNRRERTLSRQTERNMIRADRSKQNSSHADYGAVICLDEQVA